MQSFSFKTLSCENNPVDLTSTINVAPLCFGARFLAIKSPILSENISSPKLSITPTLSPSPSNPKPTSALFSFTALAIACSISRSSGLGLYFGNVKSKLQSNSTTSHPIPLKICGANIPAVPFPQATTALIFFLILFFEIKLFI